MIPGSGLAAGERTVAWMCPREASQGPGPSRPGHGMQRVGLGLTAKEGQKSAEIWQPRKVVGSGQWEARLTNVSSRSGQMPGGSSAKERQDLRGYQQRQDDSLGTGPFFLITIMKFEVPPEPKSHLGRARWRRANLLKDGTLMPKKARNSAETGAQERGI